MKSGNFYSLQLLGVSLRRL